MTSRRRGARFTGILIGFSTLLAACGGNTEPSIDEAAPAGDAVEIVTVTEYSDGTVLGPDDEADTGAEKEPASPETAAPGSDSAGGADDDHRDAPAALAPGEIEFIGTVEKQSTSEVLNGNPVPNPGSQLESDRYYVLVLDEPVEVTLNKAGDQNYSQVNEIVSLGEVTKYADDSARWDPYVGKRVRLIATKADLSYPSDTSLPLGALGLWQNGRVEEL